jgi:hypothetical protein
MPTDNEDTPPGHAKQMRALHATLHRAIDSAHKKGQSVGFYDGIRAAGDTIKSRIADKYVRRKTKAAKALRRVWTTIGYLQAPLALHVHPANQPDPDVVLLTAFIESQRGQGAADPESGPSAGYVQGPEPEHPTTGQSYQLGREAEWAKTRAAIDRLHNPTGTPGEQGAVETAKRELRDWLPRSE